MRAKPETIAHLSIEEFCFSKRQIEGVVEASQFQWTFTWFFHKGLLSVDPPLGRALIENALLRFLLKKDYELEAGNQYNSLFQPSFKINILIQSKLRFAIIF